MPSKRGVLDHSRMKVRLSPKTVSGVGSWKRDALDHRMNVRTLPAVVVLGTIIGTFLLLQNDLPGFSYAWRYITAEDEADLTSIPIPEYKFLYLHVGKAGGGTVGARLASFWKLKVKSCHPKPCPGRVVPIPDWNRSIALSVRDPVDRFLSAFYFRVLRQKQCRKGGNRWACREWWNHKREARVLFDKHGEDVNSLAEALCDDADSDTAREELEAAREDVKAIAHAAWSLSDWVEGVDWGRSAADIFPLVQESGYSLEDEIDAAVEWAQERSRLDGPSEFTARRELAQNLEKDKSLSKAVAKPQYLHSSKSEAKISLSPRGEECLVHHFAGDYELLRGEIRAACKTETCEKAVQSILDRREHLLGH